MNYAILRTIEAMLVGSHPHCQFVWRPVLPEDLGKSDWLWDTMGEDVALAPSRAVVIFGISVPPSSLLCTSRFECLNTRTYIELFVPKQESPIPLFLAEDTSWRVTFTQFKPKGGAKEQHQIACQLLGHTIESRGRTIAPQELDMPNAARLYRA